MPPEQQKLRGLLLVPDGLVYPIFKRLLEQGDLPNFSRYVYDRSLVNVDHAFSCHPSATTECMQAINTGRYPHDPGAVSYFKETNSVRNTTGRDYLSGSNCAGLKTVFHYVDPWTISIYNTHHDGVNEPHWGWLSFNNLSYFLGALGETSNQIAVRRVIEAFRERPVKFAEVYLHVYDRFAHTIRSEKKLEDKYRRFDRYVGEMCDVLENRGILDETLIVFLSDHSMSDVEQSVDQRRQSRDLLRDDAYLPRQFFGRHQCPWTQLLS